ncbi:hypothetical protein [Nostoc sp. NIES-3756]|nr:hypothetical protein [Nostoc sp. NIES-3756]
MVYRRAIAPVAHILHQAAGSRTYTGKTHTGGFQILDFALVCVGGRAFV